MNIVFYKFIVRVHDRDGKMVYMDTATGFTRFDAIKKIAEKFDGKEWDNKVSKHQYPLTFSTEEVRE